MNFPLAITTGEQPTFGQWIDIYDGIIEKRPIKPSTLKDKRLWLRYLRAEFGERAIGSIMPYEIAHLGQRVAAVGKETSARRVVIEAKDIFNEALLHGWIYRNPAYTLKPHRPRVRRRRLSLDVWKQMLQLTSTCALERRVLLLALASAQRRADLSAMRFDHVYDGLLHVQQQKTGRFVAVPIDLRLDVIDLTLGDVIEECRRYASGSQFMLADSRGRQVHPWRLTAIVADLHERVSAKNKTTSQGTPPSLHEIRSLAKRLYREQGVDTQALLGHKYPSTTNLYNDDRGLSACVWKVVRTSPMGPAPQREPERS